MLDSKKRAYLRGLANPLETIFQVGRSGVNDNMVKQISDALEVRELVKMRVLENSLMTAREAAEELAPQVNAEVVQVIGSRFTLYRPSKTLPAEKRIVLPK